MYIKCHEIFQISIRITEEASYVQVTVNWRKIALISHQLSYLDTVSVWDLKLRGLTIQHTDIEPLYWKLIKKQ